MDNALVGIKGRLIILARYDAFSSLFRKGEQQLLPFSKGEPEGICFMASSGYHSTNPPQSPFAKGGLICKLFLKRYISGSEVVDSDLKGGGESPKPL